MNKLLIITGPTATGKTGFGIELAKKFNGEIISADSRQVYKFMDIGTGKDKDEYLKNGVKVWGIDLVNPDYNFNVADYVKYAADVISDIQNRNKLPIIVGGTALYIKALLEPFETMDVPPNQELRNKLVSYSINELQEELKKIDIQKWKKMNDSDRNNPRRLIRAIEVAFSRHSGKYAQRTHPESLSSTHISDSGQARMTNNVLLISLSAKYSYLYPRIDKRVDDRMSQGAIQEIQELLNMDYTFNLPSMTASGYKEFENYQLPITNNQLTSEQIISISQRWKFNEHSYARRQVSFINKFLKQESEKSVKIMEVNIETPVWQKEVSGEVGQWYSSNTNDPQEN